MTEAINNETQIKIMSILLWVSRGIGIPAGLIAIGLPIYALQAKDSNSYGGRDKSMWLKVSNLGAMLPVVSLTFTVGFVCLVVSIVCRLRIVYLRKRQTPAA